LKLKKEFKSLEKSAVELTVTIEKAEVESAYKSTLANYVKHAQIPGFRKGHISREQFEKRFGVESLYNTALDVLFNDFYKEIIANKELAQRVISQPMPGVESKIEKGKAFTVSLTFDVYPEPTLPAYKGVEVAKKNVEVTDAEVNESINNILKSQAKLEEKAEQVIAKGDYATFDFVGKVDGKEFEGGKADNYELQIGSGQFIPGFEDQMIGMKAEEVKDKAEDIKDAAADKAEDIKDSAADKVDDIKDKAEDIKDAAADKAEDIKDIVSDKLDDIKDITDNIELD
jgi:trigger factor